MPIEVTMPRLSDTMESGTVIKWNVKEGDEVSSGQAIADIETDKATMEMQVFDEGRIAKIMVPEGQMVNVGTVIALLAEEGEDVRSVAGPAKAGEERDAKKAPAPIANGQAEPANASPTKAESRRPEKPAS